MPLLYPASPHSSAPTASSSLSSLSSARQQQQQPQSVQQSLSISTFNLLAPCYKRMQDGGREADFPEYMERRAIETATFIRCVKLITAHNTWSVSYSLVFNS